MREREAENFRNTVLGISGRDPTHSRDININMDVIRSITHSVVLTLSSGEIIG